MIITDLVRTVVSQWSAEVGGTHIDSISRVRHAAVRVHTGVGDLAQFLEYSPSYLIVVILRVTVRCARMCSE